MPQSLNHTWFPSRFGEIRYREPKSKLSPIKTISQPSPIRPTASKKLKQTNKSNAKEEKIEKRASLSKVYQYQLDYGSQIVTR